MQRMTKGERDDLLRLIKQREKLARSAASQRSAAMLAEFEQQISACHSFATNEVWKAAAEAAAEAARKAAEQVMAEADRLGIPREFQPRLSITMMQRGENAYKERRDELRRVAKAEIDALEKIACVQIEAESVRAQTEVIANGLNSTDALNFLKRLPSMETMMPALDVTDIQRKLAERARNRPGYTGPHLIE